MKFEFLQPLGLLGLIGVAVLIIIYILKNKHTEQVISSTYLWTLSERFLKRRNPISRIAGIISLILQILAVTFISFGIAQPKFTFADAANDYVFILDATGSMNYLQNGKSRFAIGKEKIGELIEDSANGSHYTLITAGESVGVLYEDVADEKEALSLLNAAQITAAADSVADMQQLAQKSFAANPSAKIYLITDKAFDSVRNVELIRISQAQENYAVSDLAYFLQNQKLIVTGKAVSYESDATLSLLLEVKNNAGDLYTQEIPELQVQGLKGADVKDAPTNIRFEVDNPSFKSLKVTLKNEDGLPLDNESMLYDVNSVDDEDNKVLIVSEDKFFLERALGAIVEVDEARSISEYKGKIVENTYQLVVFEGIVPEELPDTPVWFVNPSSDVTGCGFSVVGKSPQAYSRLAEYSASTSTRVQELLKEIVKSDVYLLEYVECNFYRSFQTLLSLDGDPLISVGTNAKNKRQVVFSFDFHQSNFPLTVDYATIIRNLWKYSHPTMVTQTSYECGEILSINVFSDSTGLRIETPSGKISYLDTSSDLAEYTLTEVGTYTITQVQSSETRTSNVYSNIPKEERISTTKEEAFVLEGTPSKERRDGIYDDLIVLLIILTVIFLADWGVYCYEQHQLR